MTRIHSRARLRVLLSAAALSFAIGVPSICRSAYIEYLPSTNPGDFTNRASAGGPSVYEDQATLDLSTASAGDQNTYAVAEIINAGGTWSFRTTARAGDFGIPLVSAWAQTVAFFRIMPEPGELWGQPFTLFVHTNASPNQMDLAANDGRGLWGATSYLTIYGLTEYYGGAADRSPFTLAGFIGQEFRVTTEAFAQTHYYFDQNAFSPPFSMYNTVIIGTQATVPETSTLLMTAAGVGGIALAAWRRKDRRGRRTLASGTG